MALDAAESPSQEVAVRGSHDQYVEIACWPISAGGVRPKDPGSVDTGEADAFLKLSPASPASVTGEFVEQRLALFDYALKSQAMRIKELNAPARPPEE